MRAAHGLPAQDGSYAFWGLPINHLKKEHDMTATAIRNPATYTHGLGELIRAHRLYIGQQMAAVKQADALVPA